MKLTAHFIPSNIIQPFDDYQKWLDEVNKLGLTTKFEKRKGIEELGLVAIDSEGNVKGKWNTGKKKLTGWITQ